MKDYTLIIDTLNTAETLLKDYTAQTEQEIKNKGEDIPTQIAEYLYQVLTNADFPDDADFCAYSPLKNYVCNEMSLNFSDYTGGYRALLWMSGKSFGHFGIYLKEDGYRFDGNSKDVEVIIALCELWPTFKQILPHKIDRALEKRNREIKKKADELNRKRAIVDNFQL